MKRLIKHFNVKTKRDHQFDFQKAIEDFKKEYNIKERDLKDKTQNNLVYKMWNNYMFENYPIWSMSSVAYILRGWSYLVESNHPYLYIGNEDLSDVEVGNEE